MADWIMADLMAAGLHSRCAIFRTAATGDDIEGYSSGVNLELRWACPATPCCKYTHTRPGDAFVSQTLYRALGAIPRALPLAAPNRFALGTIEPAAVDAV